MVNIKTHITANISDVSVAPYSSLLVLWRKKLDSSMRIPSKFLNLWMSDVPSTYHPYHAMPICTLSYFSHFILYI